MPYSIICTNNEEHIEAINKHFGFDRVFRMDQELKREQQHGSMAEYDKRVNKRLKQYMEMSEEGIHTLVVEPWPRLVMKGLPEMRAFRAQMFFIPNGDEVCEEYFNARHKPMGRWPRFVEVGESGEVTAAQE